MAVYLPGSPDPWSGTISIVTEDRIARLDSDLEATLNIFKNLGKGAGDASPEQVNSRLQEGSQRDVAGLWPQARRVSRTLALEEARSRAS